ncbi:MAG: hypothetical protein HOE90_17740 [Bacteriovoracaceae bacterium]|jgi:hypothetical protein|nr:hypothetical protein [Bacteriovoracaceae bacterium]
MSYHKITFLIIISTFSSLCWANSDSYLYFETEKSYKVEKIPPCQIQDDFKVVVCTSKKWGDSKFYYEVDESDRPPGSELVDPGRNFGRNSSKFPTKIRSEGDPPSHIAPLSIRDIDRENCRVKSMRCGMLTINEHLFPTLKKVFHDPQENQDFITVYGLDFCPNGLTRFIYTRESAQKSTYIIDGVVNWMDTFDVLGCDTKETFAGRLARGITSKL